MGLAVQSTGSVQDRREIHRFGPATCGLRPHLQKIGAAHQLVHAWHAKLCHMLPQFLRGKTHKVDNIFRLARKPPAQLGVLGCDANGAGIQIAYPHHHAAHRYQRGGGKAEFLRAQHAGDGHIPAAHQLAVGFQHHPGAQPVLDQGLVRFGQAQLPGQACVMDGGAGRRAGAAVVAGDQHHLCAGFGHTRRHCSHSRLTHQLYRDAGLAVGVF